jgi:hypothetical protein
MKKLSILTSLLFSFVFGSFLAFATGIAPLAAIAIMTVLSAIPTGATAGSLMVSAGLDFAQLTPPNGAVIDMRKLLFLQTLVSDKIELFHTVDTKVFNGDKVGAIGDFAEVGKKAGASCGPTFGTDKARVIEKTWAIGEYEVAEEICYKDILATVAKFELKDGTEAADVTGTIVTEIYTPLLEKALERMVWRLVWFSDTAAALVSGAGKIKNGTDITLFTTTDGLWKKLLAVIAGNAAQKVAISKNAEATYALQMVAPTDAIQIIDALIYKANMKLRNASDKFIMCTRSMTDAFEQQMTGGTVYTQIQWETAENGMQYFKRKGVDIYPIDLWDVTIQTYEDNGTKFNSPHRAVFTTKSNLRIGTPSSDTIAMLDVWFNKDLQVTRMLAKDQIGANIIDDTLLMVAI